MPQPPVSRPAQPQLGALFEEGARGVSRVLPVCLGDAAVLVRSHGVESQRYADRWSQMSAATGQAVAAAFSVTGAFGGAVALVVHADELPSLLEARLPRAHQPECAETNAAAFGEIGNILVSTFLNVVADRLRTFCIPSVPQVIQDSHAAVLARVAGLGGHDAEAGRRRVYAVRWTLERGAQRASVQLIALPDERFDAGLARLS